MVKILEFLNLGIFKLIKWNQDRRLKNAIYKANKMAFRTGCKFMVLRYKHRFLVKSKKQLKQLIKEGYFVSGFSIHDIEKIALYITKIH
jgi:hypothetical protein